MMLILQKKQGVSNFSILKFEDTQTKDVENFSKMNRYSHGGFMHPISHSHQTIKYKYQIQKALHPIIAAPKNNSYTQCVALEVKK